MLAGRTVRGTVGVTVGGTVGRTVAKFLFIRLPTQLNKEDYGAFSGTRGPTKAPYACAATRSRG